MKLIIFILLLSCLKTIENLELKSKIDEAYWLYIKEDDDEQLEKFLNKNENRELDLNVLKNGDGESSLTLAIKNKSLLTLKFLLNSNKIDIEQENERGKTALVTAILEIEDSLEKDEIIDILFLKGANVNKRYGLKGNNALMLAIIEGDVSTVNKILKIDSLEINADNLDEETALILALKSKIDEDKRVEIIKSILSNKKVDNILNLRDRSGKSALIYSISARRPEILFLLTLKSGIDINIQDYQGKTPLMHAIDQKNFIAINLLLKDDRLALDVKDINNKNAVNYLLENFDNEIFELISKKNLNSGDKIYIDFINEILEKIKNSNFDDVHKFFEINDCYNKNKNVFENLIKFCFNYSFKDKNVNFLERILDLFKYISENNKNFYEKFYEEYICIIYDSLCKSFNDKELWWLKSFFKKLKTIDEASDIILELLEFVNKDEDSILTLAAKNNNTEILKYILSFFDKNDALRCLDHFSTKNKKGKTAIDYDKSDILKNYFEKCKMCLKLLNVYNELKYYIYISEFGKYKEKLKSRYLSIESASEKNKLIFEQFIFLMEKNKENIILDLIEDKNFNINFNYRDEKGAGLIHYCALYGKLDLINKILDIDISHCNSKDYEENNILIYLINSEFLEEDHKLNILEELLKIEEIKSNINSANAKGLTPILLACIRGSKKLVKALIHLKNLDLKIKYESKNLVESILDFSEKETYDDIYDINKTDYLNIIELILKKEPSLAEGKYLINFVLNNNNYISECIFNVLKKINFNIENFITDIEKIDEKINLEQIYLLVNKGNLVAIEKVIKLRKLEIFNFYFKDGKTFLHHLVKFPLLLEKSIEIEDIDLNIHNGNGYTPLIEAILLNNLDSLKLLIENKNVEINILFENKTPLMLAIANNNLKASEILLQREDINLFLVNNKLKTALEVAIDFENFEIAKTILEKGKEKLNVSLENFQKLKGDQLKLLEKAIRRSNISIYYKAFMEAAKRGKIEIIEKSLDLNIISSNNEEEYLNDIFNIFIKNNDISSFERLITKKKEYIQQKIFGEYLIHRVVKENRFEFLKLLLKAGANLNQLDNQEGNLAHTLCESDYDNIEILEFLIEKGLNLDKEDIFQNTPFIVACYKGNRKSAKLLIEQKVNINKQNKDGNTALILACSGGNLSIVKMLLGDKNLDIKIRNNLGENALDISKNSLKELLDSIFDEDSFSSSSSYYSNSSSEYESEDDDFQNNFILQNNLKEIISLLENYKK